MPTHAALAAAIFGLLCGQPGANTPTTPPSGPSPAPAAAHEEPPVLAGPAVVETHRVTIVEHDYAGKVRPLEVTPEEAAVNVMDLDEASRDAAAGVLAARAAILDKVMRENIDLISMLATAGESRDFVRLAPLSQELHRKLEPLRRRGSLREELRGALPEDRRAEFERLVDEYWEAVRAEAPRGQRFRRVVEERVRVFGKEVERSYKRQERSGELALEYILGRLDLPADKEEQVRKVAAQHFAARGGRDATDEDNALLFLKVGAHLTAEQQARLVKVLRGL